MARHTRKRGFRIGTVSVPKTKKALKNVYRRTKNRVRFLVKGVKSRAKKIPSYVDRLMSRAVRTVTRRR
jgi:ubiquinone/menaquinone biosynthesis C-methylase UbiE